MSRWDAFGTGLNVIAFSIGPQRGDKAIRMRFVLVVVVLAAMALESGGASRLAQARAQERVASQTCERPESDAQRQPLAADSPLPDGLPAGLTLDVLADRSTERWPEFARGLVLTVRQLTLAPGAFSDMRRTEGPLLFYVESGPVAISINGRTEDYEAGSAVLVETGQNYLLRSDAPTPAILLRLALVPPEEETTVSNRGGVAQVRLEGNDVVAESASIQSLLLVSADITVPKGAAHLFLACLTWDDPASDPGSGSYPGPVGFQVLAGKLLVGEGEVLDTGQSTVFPPRTPRRLRAGDPPPILLMFGAIPTDAPLWTPATAARGGSCAPRVLACL
jgi:quercetin dioxygenase-like cupin family protein